MAQPQVGLSSTELAGLWSTYIQDDMSRRYMKVFLQHLQDEEIKQFVQESVSISESHMKLITQLFEKEQIPIPQGFLDSDVDLTAPALYEDTYALSFVYGMTRIALANFGVITSGMAREDVLQFFSQCLTETNKLYTDGIGLLLKKGLYDRPPNIPYPDKVEFVTETSFLAGWFGEQRPLNCIELTDIFFNIERNYFGINLLMGFIQVTEDEEIKNFFLRGKSIAQKQIVILNDLLKEEELFGVVQTRSLVTNSTAAPYTAKLMLSLINSLNAAQISYLGVSLSKAMRRDLATHYSRLLVEVLQYAEDGLKIMINRGWLEQAPQTANRKELAKS